PRRDRDTFVLKCVARTTPCPTGQTTTTTTTLSGGTTTTTERAISMGCSFHDGKCTGTCGAPGATCGTAVGTGSSACRQVSCGNADTPQCNGACASASDACVSDPISNNCTCFSIR